MDEREGDFTRQRRGVMDEFKLDYAESRTAEDQLAATNTIGGVGIIPSSRRETSPQANTTTPRIAGSTIAGPNDTEYTNASEAE